MLQRGVVDRRVIQREIFQRGAAANQEQRLLVDPARLTQETEVIPEPVGETLLAAPPSSLLSMGERGPLLGTSVDAPEQFS